jgi:hypothetical protein
MRSTWSVGFSPRGSLDPQIWIFQEPLLVLLDLLAPLMYQRL